MAKNTLGGKRTTAAAGIGVGIGGGGGQPNTQNQNQPQQNLANATQATGGIAAFQAMTDQQKANVIMQAQNMGRVTINGSLAPNTVFQKLNHIMGFDQAPQLVTDDALDNMKGEDIYRAFSGATQSDADGITMNTLLDKETFFSDTGGSLNGRGIYFYWDSSSKSALQQDIQSYARSWSGHCNIVRAKFNDNARFTTRMDMRAAVDKEISSGSAFGRALSSIDRNDAISIMAVSKGYNVIGDNWSRSILSREAITASYTYHRVTDDDRRAAANGSLTWKSMMH